MANTFKQVIPTANKKKTVKNYDFDHITTAPFMQPMPIAIRECVPNMTFNVNLQSFTRLNPLVKPTFGRARVNNRAFFVPFRTIMPRWNEFLASEPIYSLNDNIYGIQTSVPCVRNLDLLTVLYSLSTPSDSSNYDFSYINAAQNVSYRILSSGGRFAFRLFLSLGYKINWNSNVSEVYSALPLLAYAKVMLDWYFPSQYINASVVQTLTPYFMIDSLNRSVIPSNVLLDLIGVCNFCAYNDSLYVDAWDRPVAPNFGTESQISIPDVTYQGGATIGADAITATRVDNKSASGTPLSLGDLANSSNLSQGVSITQYQHDILRALTDYTTRHRLSGVRAVDRLLSEYGINLSSEIMKRSIMVGSDDFNIQFGDVMAHSDTYDENNNSGAALGDFAGKGIGYGNHSFSYQLGNEFGYFLVINSVIPDVGYYQGVNRIVKHKSLMDFWHADFDGLGVQAVAADEVYCPDEYDSAVNDVNLHQHVFGFVPRYAEYKTAPSVLSGMFALHGNNDIKAFSFMRDLSSLFANGTNPISHTLDFVRGVDAVQYNRIFYNADPKVWPENFIFIHHFEVEQTDETAPLYETYDFKEVNKAVEVHTQAAKVN